MARYRVTAPDGKTYYVTAPEGATEQDVMSYVQSQSSRPASPAPAFTPEVPQAQIPGSPASMAQQLRASQPVDRGGFLENVGRDISNAAKGIQDPDVVARGIISPRARLASGDKRWAAPSLLTDFAAVAGGARRGAESGDINQMIRPALEAVPTAIGMTSLRAVPGAAADVAKMAASTRIAPEVAAPTREAIRQASQEAYQTARNAGVVVNPGSFRKFVDKTEGELIEKGFDTDLHPQAAAALKRLKVDADKGEPVDLQQIEILRRVANEAAQSAQTDGQWAKANAIIGSIDNFVNNIGANELVEGNADVAIPALNQARALWAKNAKMGDIEDIVAVAERQDDPQKYIKQQFTRITKNNDRFKRYTKDEQALIEQIAKTGAAETVGKLAPSLDLTGLAKIGLYAGGTLANPLTLAVPLGGMVAKATGAAFRDADIKALQDAIARGSGQSGLLDRLSMVAPRNRQRLLEAPKSAGLLLGPMQYPPQNQR